MDNTYTLQDITIGQIAISEAINTAYQTVHLSIRTLLWVSWLRESFAHF